MKTAHLPALTSALAPFVLQFLINSKWYLLILTVRRRFVTLTIEVLVTKRQRSFCLSGPYYSRVSKGFTNRKKCDYIFFLPAERNDNLAYMPMPSVLQGKVDQSAVGHWTCHSLGLIHICALGIFMLRIALSYPTFSIYPFKEWEIN